MSFRLLPIIAKCSANKLTATWREPFGQAGLLTFASNVLTAEGASDDLKIQALRLIGNSCADTGKQTIADLDKLSDFAKMRIGSAFCNMAIFRLSSTNLRMLL